MNNTNISKKKHRTFDIILNLFLTQESPGCIVTNIFLRDIAPADIVDEKA